MTDRNGGKRARLLAFYLPQFHPIPENDAWWGAGFTEWTNVTRARPLFRDQYQPRQPADLGYYDLRDPEARVRQAEIAKQAGIEGFVYYHYWFAGKRLLERPLTEVVASGQPDYPFCVCWANQSWSNTWHGALGETLIEQTYPGAEDAERHFITLLATFADPRYVKVDGKPVFVVFRPRVLPAVERFIAQWRELAVKNGLAGLYFVAHLFANEVRWNFKARGFDAATAVNHSKAFRLGARAVLQRRLMGHSGSIRLRRAAEFARRGLPRFLRHGRWGLRNIIEYEDAAAFFLDGVDGSSDLYPCAVPGWDNTPRTGFNGFVLHNSTPELFRTHLREALAAVAGGPPERRLIFVKSWNEWAEGNYLEPDARFGHEYLDVVRELVTGPADQIAES